MCAAKIMTPDMIRVQSIAQTLKNDTDLKGVSTNTIDAAARYVVKRNMGIIASMTKDGGLQAKLLNENRKKMVQDAKTWVINTRQSKERIVNGLKRIGAEPGPKFLKKLNNL